MGRHFHKRLRDKNGKIIIHRVVGMVMVGIILAVLFALVFAFLVQYLWNTILVSVFAVKMITFWQAFGIIILAKILFGGCGKHGAIHKGHDHFCNEGQNGKEFFCDVDGKWDRYRDFWKEHGSDAWKEYLDKNENPDK